MGTPLVMTVKSLDIRILKGSEVLDKISNQVFIDNWDHLFNSCPWATIYQSSKFVSLWYHAYHHKFEPLLVLGEENECLVGLIPMCVDRDGGILAAGLSQAEYQTWISTGQKNNEFISKSILSLKNQFPSSKISFKYLPGNTPLGWCKNNSLWRKQSWIRTHKHPLMKIDEKDLEKELRKKNKREKINRLKRLGDLKMERISNYREFEEMYDELASQNDFRKGAVYDAVYFHKNKTAKKFLLSLFKNGLLHVSVLKLNQQIIAANVGTMGKNCVHLQGMNTHSPIHSKYSPGILHFLMLGLMLREEGVAFFDLTPGKDPYKDMLANEYGEAYSLEFRDPGPIQLMKVKYYISQKARTSLIRCGFHAFKQRAAKKQLAILKEKIGLMRRTGLSTLIREKLSALTAIKPPTVFEVSSYSMLQTPSSYTVEVDSYRDMLDFDPTGSVVTRWEFLDDALYKMEAGLQPYTMSDGNLLMFCIWREKRFPPVAVASNATSVTPALFTDLYVHVTAKNMIDDFLQKVLTLSETGVPDSPPAVIHVKEARHGRLLEKLGYKKIEWTHVL
ncbi:GNAT family N-acetyltransferase [Negadavirga shengliensis]|uniref:GNAT family N-acetyltransferase n=1 Tax=Negadavirga shengliensis TaxID=1389218 RepID=A0ABV9T380_9BACT